MVHLAAVLLTLFPGFGTGYLLLGRFRKFVIHFLFSSFLASLAAIYKILGVPPAAAGMVFAIAPWLIWNVYHANRLWLDVPAEYVDSEAEREGLSQRVAPCLAMSILVLGVVLGILAIPMFLPEKKHEGCR